MYRRRKMKEVLTKEELSTFFNACENYMYKTIFMMTYGSCLRTEDIYKICKRIYGFKSKRRINKSRIFYNNVQVNNIKNIEQV